MVWAHDISGLHLLFAIAGRLQCGFALFCALLARYNSSYCRIGCVATLDRRRVHFGANYPCGCIDNHCYLLAKSHRPLGPSNKTWLHTRVSQACDIAKLHKPHRKCVVGGAASLPSFIARESACQSTPASMDRSALFSKFQTQFDLRCRACGTGSVVGSTARRRRIRDLGGFRLRRQDGSPIRSGYARCWSKRTPQQCKCVALRSRA